MNLLAEKINETLRATIAKDFKNTTLGLVRIKKNLGIENYSNDQIVKHMQKIIISTPLEKIEKKGKNYYFSCNEYNSVLTINSRSLTIITAKRLKNTLTDRSSGLAETRRRTR